MAEGLSGLAGLVPSGSVAAVLLVVIFYLLRQNHQDRTQYRGEVARIEQRAADDRAELIEQASHDRAEMLRQHREEMSSVRDEIGGLRKELRDSMTETEQERRARWHAEDAAARYRRQLEDRGVVLDDR